MNNLCKRCGKNIMQRGRIFCCRTCYSLWQKENLTGESHPRFIPKKDLICQNCGKIFHTKPSLENSALYCSKLCSSEGIKKNKVELICKVCQTPFSVLPSRLGKSVVCSAECRNKYRKKSRRTTLICQQCNKKYSVNNFRKNSKFCSKKCKNNSIKKGQELNCETCGKLFWVFPSKLDGRRFCSRDCRRGKTDREKQKHQRYKNCPAVCTVCGNSYYVYNYELKTTKYCSRSCKTKGTINWVSSIEIKLKEELIKKGLLPTAQHQIGKYCIDLAFLDEKLAVECDGDYWHNLPAAKEKDARKDKFLNEKGWQVLRLKEHEINGDVESCAIKVCKVLYTLKN